ncbi:chemotaxis protein CheX [Sphingomonas insulae]|uniref:MlaB-like STAS domain-containing protein n=1 Tax=Sphingomonas insulae TaxID=424800 RepID=A0ABN1HKY6_9SPHN|nr:STAS domain-containing protein [Sphingomonas insulae]NIJ30328.1 chemotaxis protein CheX [Sphingomonas insulae]
MPAHPLPNALDTGAAGSLRDTLLGRIERREDLQCDGVEVSRIGLACLQVLASARLSAIAHGLGFGIINPSEAMVRMMNLAGLADALSPVAATAAAKA